MSRSRDSATRRARRADGATSCEIRTCDLVTARPWETVFGRRAPVELEIGCGKGRFILRSAAAMPARDFLAIERALAFYRVARDRAERMGLANLRLLCSDAAFVVRHVLPDAGVAAVHILFPDPWPKSRHHKRRMIRPDVVRGLVRILADGGLLNVATDHDGYWQAILAALAQVPELERQEGFALDARLPEGEDGHTNYEVKYRAGGRAISQGTWRRRARLPEAMPSTASRPGLLG